MMRNTVFLSLIKATFQSTYSIVKSCYNYKRSIGISILIFQLNMTSTVLNNSYVICKLKYCNNSYIFPSSKNILRINQFSPVRDLQLFYSYANEQWCPKGGGNVRSQIYPGWKSNGVEFWRECETAGQADVGLARILIAINSKMGFLTKCSKLTISLTLFLERSRESQLVTAQTKKAYL